MGDGTGGYEQRYVEGAGVQLSYTDWGPADGRAVILLHGLQTQSHTWDPIAQELAMDRRVLSLDFRGHGDSDWSREGYYLRHFASDVRALVDGLQLSSYDLVGHSLGSRVAAIFAGQRPNGLGRVVMCDAGPEFPKAASAFAKDALGGTAPVRGFRDETAALAYFREAHPEWRQDFVELHARHQLRRNWAGKLVFKADPDLFWLLGSAGAADDGSVWNALDEIDVPVLVLRGSRSPFLDGDLVDQMLARLADGQADVLDTGHYIPREAPDEFLTVVRRFLDQPQEATQQSSAAGRRPGTGSPA